MSKEVSIIIINRHHKFPKVIVIMGWASLYMLITSITLTTPALASSTTRSPLPRIRTFNIHLFPPMPMSIMLNCSKRKDSPTKLSTLIKSKTTYPPLTMPQNLKKVNPKTQYKWAWISYKIKNQNSLCQKYKGKKLWVKKNWRVPI